MKPEWNRPLGLKESPYAYRWVLPLPGGYSLRLHRWVGDDDPDAMHDHPTWFCTFILSGGYIDVNERTDGWTMKWERLHRFDFRFRPASHRHRVFSVKPNTWTLCLFGKDKKHWRFYLDGKSITRDKYFAEIGHHAPDGGRVRFKPNGERIT